MLLIPEYHHTLLLNMGNALMTNIHLVYFIKIFPFFLSIEGLIIIFIDVPILLMLLLKVDMKWRYHGSYLSSVNMHDIYNKEQYTQQHWNIFSCQNIFCRFLTTMSTFISLYIFLLGLFYILSLRCVFFFPFQRELLTSIPTSSLTFHFRSNIPYPVLYHLV